MELDASKLIYYIKRGKEMEERVMRPSMSKFLIYEGEISIASLKTP